MSAAARFREGLEKIKMARPLGDSATEANDEGTVAGKNEIAAGHGDQKGVPVEGFLWGQEPPKDQPLLGKRSPTHETFTESVEQINRDEQHDLLERAFANFASASATAKAIVAQNLVKGRPGTYVTHTKTLLEKVRDL